MFQLALAKSPNAKGTSNLAKGIQLRFRYNFSRAFVTFSVAVWPYTLFCVFAVMYAVHLTYRAQNVNKILNQRRWCPTRGYVNARLKK